MKHIEDWSIGYEILRPIGYLVHRLEHRNMIVEGLENIPKNEPIILAPNHQNALSDDLAVLLASHLQPVFLGRADMFKNKLAARLLHFFKVTPVFRIRDGKETLDKNQEVFDNCVRILKKNKCICIYPEASHIGLKSMNPHKKAIPRIALLAGVATDFEINVKVVPVGLYFSHYYNYRRDLIVSFGKPLNSNDYYTLYKEQGEAKATLAFRNDLLAAIKELVVQVDDRPSYDLYDQGFEIMKPNLARLVHLKNHPKNIVRGEQILTKKLENYFEADPSRKEELVKKAQHYKKLKQRVKFSERALDKGRIGIGEMLLKLLLVVAMLPFSLYAIVANGWLFYLTHYPHLKLVKDRHFYSTISFGLSYITFQIWYVAQAFILHAIFHNWLIVLGVLVFSIPSGIIAWEQGQIILNTYHRIKIGIYLRKKNKTYLQLSALRTELKDFFEKLILS